jgi:hypothetical protein
MASIRRDALREEWGISFNEYVNGYPIVGGSKTFSVIVNMYGTVLSAGFWNPELEYAGEIECISAQQAYAVMLAGNALEFIVQPESTIIINNV